MHALEAGQCFSYLSCKRKINSIIIIVIIIIITTTTIVIIIIITSIFILQIITK